MTVTETNRFEMHLKLRETMGDDVADTLMQHLPPTGWADVARKSDIDNLAALMDARFVGLGHRFESVDSRFASIDTRFASIDSRFASIDTRFASIDTRFDDIDSRLSGIVAGMWTMGAVFTTAFVGLFTLIATKL